MPSSTFDLHLPSGRLRLRRHGSPDARPVFCLPGLSYSLESFDYLGTRLGGETLQVLAVDLRGRGGSEVTPPGTYGWANHARDLLAAADALEIERFAVVGWSMGAGVAMCAASMAGARIERLVSLDIVSAPGSEALGLIRLAVERLGTVFPSVGDYLGLLRGLGTIRPWSDDWERYFSEDLIPVEGGVVSRTSREAVLEDLEFSERQEARELWRTLSMPVMLVRAALPLLPGSDAYVVSASDREEFLRLVPTARVVEVEANHYGVGTHPATVEAVRDFLLPNLS